MNFTFDDLERMMRGARRVRNEFTVPCPICGPQCRTKYNRHRKVLGIRPDADGNRFIYHCCRCEIKGYAFRNHHSGSEPIKIVKMEEPNNSKLALKLWEQSVPIHDTPAQLYLRRRQCEIDSPNIRFLPAHGTHHRAMIARFSSKDGSTNGIHLTRINRDGTKADVRPVKIMLGPSNGWPIIVSDTGSSKEVLCIAEGIEDAASLALATGGAAWAAGSAGRIAACLRRAKNYLKIIIAVDNDFAGKRALEKALLIRPRLVAVDFCIDGDMLDANAMLQRHGIDAVASYIAHAQRRAA